MCVLHCQAKGFSVMYQLYTDTTLIKEEVILVPPSAVTLAEQKAIKSHDGLLCKAVYPTGLDSNCDGNSGPERERE